MKKIIIYGLSLMLLAVSSVSLTGCIEEVEPTSGATQEQVDASSSAVEGLLLAIPAYSINYWNSNYMFSFGYPGIMHIRDVETQDMAVYDDGSGYNWFQPWAENIHMGQDYVYGQFPWNFEYKMINSTNNLISTANRFIEEMDITSAEGEEEMLKYKAYIATARAYRAMVYLDLAREYEFLENDATSPYSPAGNNISGLTVPIVDETMTESEARNNPRATKADMEAFILADLDMAEEYISNLTMTTKTLPHLDAVYGLKARYYLWVEDYVNAEKYARLAIDNSSTKPMTESEALDTSTGFNDISKWMWGMQYTSETTNGYHLNWTSWMCNETTYGYASVAPVMIDAYIYSRISDTDWRKLMWKAPSGYTLYGKSSYVDDEVGESLMDYASLKFRPGSGDNSTYTIAAAVGVPLMRVEEMYFIEMEAVAQQGDLTRAKNLLETFMKNNRDTKYSCKVTSQDDVIEEIIFQKRIELWGEGQTFFDIKRLDYAVTRGYSGTNHLDAECLNTTTRPAWMNWVIVRLEGEGNTSVADYNNPDPTDAYIPWTE
ncbi:MAG: RagB/SusD family nutrient uptake outer membrane protein [Prevotella sp.]|nr:RagB/SusD family nutrient uptake outer membrane protein [Prevotella sp.]